MPTETKGDAAVVIEQFTTSTQHSQSLFLCAAVHIINISMQRFSFPVIWFFLNRLPLSFVVQIRWKFQNKKERFSVRDDKTLHERPEFIDINIRKDPVTLYLIRFPQLFWKWNAAPALHFQHHEHPQHLL